MMLNYEILLVTSKHIKEYNRINLDIYLWLESNLILELKMWKKMALDKLVRAAFLEIINVSGTSFTFSV